MAAFFCRPCLRMKLTLKAAAVAALIIAVNFAGSVTAGPFEDAAVAASKGDWPTALRLTRPLADQGEASAQYSLGLMYEKGLGVPQDYAAAATWYRKAAEQGDGLAQYYLGEKYEAGLGVPQNYVLAHMWFNLAAAQGEYFKWAATERDYLAEHDMTRDQVAEAQKLAREWKPPLLSHHP